MLKDSKVAGIRGHTISGRNIPELELREETKDWGSKLSSLSRVLVNEVPFYSEGVNGLIVYMLACPWQCHQHPKMILESIKNDDTQLTYTLLRGCVEVVKCTQMRKIVLKLSIKTKLWYYRVIEH